MNHYFLSKDILQGVFLMEKYVLLFVLCLLIAPLASAFDCSKTVDPQYCNTISSSNLTEIEKDSLYSLLLYTYSDFPNYAFVSKYNLGIKVTSPPYNTTVYNSVQIRNAWLSFLAVFPSVLSSA